MRLRDPSTTRSSIRRHRVSPPLAAAAVALLCASSASAERLALGGRTASMGGAAAAWGRDSAMSFVNPAGFGRVPRLSLSLSASLYRYEHITVDRFFKPGSLDPVLESLTGEPDVHGNELTSSQFSAFPGAASLLWHHGGDEPDAAHHVLSLSAVVLRNRQRAFSGDFSLGFPGDTSFNDSLAATLVTTEYRFGPGYALRLGRVNFGASLFLSYLTSTTTHTSEIFSSRSDGFISSERNEYARATAWGFQPVLGVQVEATPTLAFGVAFSPPSWHLTGDLETQGRTRFSFPDVGLRVLHRGREGLRARESGRGRVPAHV